MMPDKPSKAKLYFNDGTILMMEQLFIAILHIA